MRDGWIMDGILRNWICHIMTCIIIIIMITLMMMMIILLFLSFIIFRSLYS